MTKRDTEHRIVYELKFDDRPDLDRDGFRSVGIYKVDSVGIYKVDDLGPFRDGLGSENSRWRIRDVFTAPDGERDILFCKEIVLA